MVPDITNSPGPGSPLLQALREPGKWCRLPVVCQQSSPLCQARAHSSTLLLLLLTHSLQKKVLSRWMSRSSPPSRRDCINGLMNKAPVLLQCEEEKHETMQACKALQIPTSSEARYLQATFTVADDCEQAAVSEALENGACRAGLLDV